MRGNQWDSAGLELTNSLISLNQFLHIVSLKYPLQVGDDNGHIFLLTPANDTIDNEPILLFDFLLLG